MISKSKYMLVLGGLAFASFAAGQGKVTLVKAEPTDVGYQVRVEGENLGKPQIRNSGSSRVFRLVFNGRLAGKAKTFKVNHDGLRHVSYGWQNARPSQVYVKLYFNSSTARTITKDGNAWTVCWNPVSAKHGTPGDAFATKVNDPFASLPPLSKATATSTVAKTNSTAPTIFGPIKNTRPSATRTVQPFAIKGQVESLFQLKPAPRVTAKTNSNEIRVSLQFENTDLIQILKALALQSGVNIVTAPEVTGKLTVALQNVTVKQALDFVTTLSGIRYAQVGSTYLVTTSDKFAAAMQQIGSANYVNYETRIVNIDSGEGAQIKAALLKAIPQDSSQGRYDVLLPTEKLTLATKSETTQGGDGKSSGGNANSTSVESRAETGDNGSSKKDYYVILVGTPDRLTEVETAIHEIDARILTAGKVNSSSNLATVVIPIYSGSVKEVTAAARRAISRESKAELFELGETDPATSGDPLHMLLITGPKEGLANVELMTKTVDAALCDAKGIAVPQTSSDRERVYEVVNLNYIEPIEAARMLEDKYKGLRASLMPAYVQPAPNGAKSVTLGGADAGATSSSSNSTSSNTTGNAGGDQGSGSGSSTQGNNSSTTSSSSSSSATAAENGAAMNRNLGAEPMKLMLFGTRAQLSDARNFLAVLDVAPKQVALELRVVEMSKDEALKIGLDWSLMTGGSVGIIRIAQGLGTAVGSPGTIGSGNPNQLPGSTSSTGSTSGMIPGFTTNGGSGALAGVLDGTNEKIKVIARPNVLVTEGRHTKLFVGDEVRYIQSIQSTQNGITVQTGQVDVGVKLDVVARVGSNNSIALDMNPELSILRGFTPVPGGGNLPQTSLRTANTQVNLLDGETLAIGGLIQDQDRKTYGGIPILKDLPIVGQLFGRTDTRTNKQEVVFFLTARVVDRNSRATAANPTKLKP